MSKKKVSTIIFIALMALLPFAIFMFFMAPVKWTDSWYIEQDIALPSFFDLMFGGEASKYFETTWAVNPGMVIIFIIQILVIVGCVVSTTLLFIKNKKLSYFILASVGALAIAAGVLSLCSSNFNISWIKTIGSSTIKTSVKDKIGIAYGSIVYGIIMIVAGIVAFLPYGLSYCLNNKKK